MSERNDHPVAIALHYAGSGAPTVTAKGRGLTAERIREIADEHGIPLWEDAALADVLARVDLGDQVPEALYRAVAEVIAFAWQLRGRTVKGSDPDNLLP